MLHFEDIDADGVAHCPGLSLDALKYLFEERGVTAVGHETLDTDGCLPKFDKFPGFPVRAWAVVPNED